MLVDISKLTHAPQVIAEEMGLKLENATHNDLGQAKRIVVDKDNTTIVGGKGKHDVIQGRIREIKAQIAKSTSDYDKEKLQERLRQLAGGRAPLHPRAGPQRGDKKEKEAVAQAPPLTPHPAPAGTTTAVGVGPP